MSKPESPRIVWTRHATDRRREWEQRLGLDINTVEGVLNEPEQIVAGHGSVRIAQSRWRGGLVRVPFRVEAGERRIITVYWTSQVDRYWE